MDKQFELEELKRWYQNNTHESPLIVRQTLMKQIEIMTGKYQTVEQKLLQWCLEYVYVQCVDDNGILEMVCESSGLTEVELMNGFENLAQDNGFELDTKENGFWKGGVK